LAAFAAEPTARPALWAPPATLPATFWAPLTTLSRAEATGPSELRLRVRLLPLLLPLLRVLGADPFPDEPELLLLRLVADGVRLAAAAVRGLLDLADPRDFVDPPDCLLAGFARCPDF
jgi:hypothetical protein